MCILKCCSALHYNALSLSVGQLRAVQSIQAQTLQFSSFECSPVYCSLAVKCSVGQGEVKLNVGLDYYNLTYTLRNTNQIGQVSNITLCF